MMAGIPKGARQAVDEVLAELRATNEHLQATNGLLIRILTAVEEKPGA